MHRPIRADACFLSIPLLELLSPPLFTLNLTVTLLTLASVKLNALAFWESKVFHSLPVESHLSCSDIGSSSTNETTLKFFHVRRIQMSLIWYFRQLLLPQPVRSNCPSFHFTLLQSPSCSLFQINRCLSAAGSRLSSHLQTFIRLLFASPHLLYPPVLPDLSSHIRCFLSKLKTSL